MPQQFKVRASKKMNNIGFLARIEIINTEHIVALVHKRFAKMRTKKSGTARDKYAPGFTA